MLASSKVDQRAERERDLTTLKSLLEPHLFALERHLIEEADQFEPEIRELTKYCMAAGGKRIRASLVFLGGWQDPPVVREDLVRLAAVVELVHLATLVHDDILDSASTRHSRTTAARKFGPSTTVLLGDALFAQAVNLSTRFPDAEVCRQISIATRRVCAGEITQTLRRGSGNLSLQDYYRIVDLKTAELFSVSCRLGAYLAGFESAYVSAVADFGRRLGVAYQIFDDLVDFFGKEETVGKTLGTDLQSGKRTLPIILLMNKLSDEARAVLQQDLRSGSQEKIAQHAAEMMKLGVYEEVVTAVLVEATAADDALAQYGHKSPTRPLLQLNERLKAQVYNLAR
jgi:octaprenyl-diphosphate synthase